MWFTAVGLAVAAPSAASLEAPATPALATDAVAFTFSAPGLSFLDGCVPIELERRVGETWVAIPRVPCPKATPATQVTGSLTLSLPPPSPGEYRAIASWGTGCDPALPFALAACTGLEYVRSERFTVLAPVAPP